MKKALITTVAVLLGMAAAAQDSIPYLSVFGQETSSWHIARFIRSVDQGGASTAVLTSFTDSSLQTAAWHPVLLGSDTALSLMESNDHSRLFLRYPGDTTAQLLMDLNLQTGDTLPVHFRNGSDTMAIVDSVYFSDGVKHLRTTLALSFSGYVGVRTPDDTTLGNTSSEVSVPLTLIEGIGPNWGLDYGRESLDSILAVSPLLLCHFRDSAIDYHQQVDTDYPRPEGSDNDPCSLEYIRYKSAIPIGFIWTEISGSIGIFHTPGGGSFLWGMTYAIDSSIHEINNQLFHSVTTIPPPFCSSNFDIALLRESHDHSKIYGIYDNHYNGLSHEILIADFNLKTGDTFHISPTYLEVLDPLHPSQTDISIVVDSIYIQNGLKHIRFSDFFQYEFDDDFERILCIPPHVPFEFIESVGLSWGYCCNLIPSKDIVSRLICAFHNNELYYTTLSSSNICDHFLYPYCNNCIVPSIDSVESTITIEIIPNPVLDNLTIEQMPTGNKTITIQDIYGRTWLVFNHSGESMTIDLPHMPSQIYLLNIQIGNKIVTKKIIKL